MKELAEDINDSNFESAYKNHLENNYTNRTPDRQSVSQIAQMSRGDMISQQAKFSNSSFLQLRGEGTSMVLVNPI